MNSADNTPVKRLLIVDDETHIVDMLADFFASEKIRVLKAESGVQALEQMSGNTIDLIITDLIMPEMDGLEFFYKARKIDPFAQVVIMTGYPSIERLVEMLEAGVPDFIIKPFNLNQLKKIVEECFARVERWRVLRSKWISKNRK